MKNVIFDVAYVGSESKDLLRRWQLNAVPLGAKFLPQNQDPTRAPSATPGATALPDDLLRPFPGYGNIQMWDYSSSGNYHALQTVAQPPVRQRRDVLGLLRLQQGPDPREQQRLQRRGDRRPASAASRSSRRRRSGASTTPTLPTTARTTSCSTSSTRRPRSPAASSACLANDWQISGIYRWSSGRPLRDQLLDPRDHRLEPHRQQRPAQRAHRGHRRPGHGLEQRSLPPDRHRGLRPAPAGQPG